MKTKSLLKAAFITVMFLVLGWSAKAQSAVTGTMVLSTTEAEDFVTIGSKMPYVVTPDANIAKLVTQGILKNSVYSWVLSGGGVLEQKATNTSLTSAAAPFDATHFVENDIAVLWGNTVGKYTLSVKEQSVSNIAGLNGCEGVEQKLDVYVVAKPTVAWVGPLVAGGCGADAGAAIDIPIKLTGTDKWEVEYKVNYYNLDAVAGTPTEEGSTVKTIVNGTVALDKTHTANIENTNLLSLNIDKGKYGRYEISIISVSDRISRKSVVESTDFPLEKYVVYALPTPTTAPIQHITNN